MSVFRPNFFSPFRPLAFGWALSFSGWGLVAVIVSANFVIFGGGTWFAAIRPSVRDWLPWALLTPLLFRLVARLPVDRSHWKMALPVQVLVCVAVLWACAWWKLQINPQRAVGRGLALRHSRQIQNGAPIMPPTPSPRRTQLFHLMSFDLPIYLMIACAAHAALFFRREQERANSLSLARLEALRMQLQPHFLFNTLNTVSGLVYHEPAKADAMLTALSDLLRLSLKTSQARELPLAHEMAFVKRYLDIMHARFEDRLDFRLEFGSDVRGALVPPLLLQPLVENAVHHGLEPRSDGGLVTVRAWREGSALRLSVEDNGVGLAKGRFAGEGIGIGHTRARLRELYGSRATLELRNGLGVTADISLPFRIAPAPVAA